MPHVTHFWKQNDTSPALVVVLRDGFGAPVNLTGATVVLNTRLRPGGTVKINGGTMGAVGSAVNGKQSYSPTAANNDTSGIYEAEVEVTFANGKIRTFPSSGYFTVEVVDDVG
jgi:hypothetical protein